MSTAVLFDLDGVLIDTEGQYTTFWKQVGEDLMPDVPDLAARIKGMTLTQILHRFFENDEQMCRVIRERLSAFEDTMEFPLIAGAIDFVDALRAEGFKVAVVTSSDEAKLNCLRTKQPDFCNHFDRIFTAEDAPRSKPAPDCYIAAAKYFGFEPETCYVFEDSLSGLRAGHDSGATVIGLTTSHPAEQLAELAHETIADFTNYTVAQMCDVQKTR